MMSVIVLKRSDLEQCVGFDLEALAAVASSFVWASSGEAHIPQPLHLDVPAHDGSFDIKTAYVVNQPAVTVKIASGFFANADLGLPTGHSLLTVFNAQTGFCEALLLDEGYLTDLRTALAGAVAAQHLANGEIATVGVVGTGAQARDQVRALQLVRKFERVLVYGRSQENRLRYQKEMEALLGVPVLPQTTVAAVVSEADCLITATPSRLPLVEAVHLHPGLHITAMGSDGKGKQELSACVLAGADVLACDLPKQARVIGECQWLPQDRKIIALGDIISGRAEGRPSAEAITICDLSGIGTQDSAIAQLALQRARALGLGMVLS